MTEVKIQNCKIEDVQVIRDILWDTMKETYSFMKEESLLELYNFNYHENKIKKIIEIDENAFYLAYINEVAVGVLYLYCDLDDLYFQINALYVLPKYQNYGVGKSLVKHVMGLVLKFKVDRIYIGVFKDNKKTFDLYIRTNFIITKEKEEKVGQETFSYAQGYFKVSDIIQKIGIKFE